MMKWLGVYWLAYLGCPVGDRRIPKSGNRPKFLKTHATFPWVSAYSTVHSFRLACLWSREGKTQKVQEWRPQR
jgi:hypothetical protein